MQSNQVLFFFLQVIFFFITRKANSHLDLLPVSFYSIILAFVGRTTARIKYPPLPHVPLLKSFKN